MGHTKRPSDVTWTPRDGIRRERYNRELIARLRKDRIDVCIVYAWREGVRAAQEAGVRAIVERVDGFGLISRVTDKSGCQRIICESRTIRGLLLSQRQLLQCRREQLVVIPNGIDLKRFDPLRYDRNRCRKGLGLKPDDFAVGTLSRLAPQKNLGHLLQALRLMKEKGDHTFARTKVIIAGPDGGSKKELIAQATRLRIAKNVRFIGSRSDVPQILCALDAFAMPSFHEGTPFALLEAMAMGLPIVASQVGSIPEIIDGNGYLVCVLQPEETFYALWDLIDKPSLRERMGQRSRALARRYDVGEMVRAYEATLLDAVRLSKTRGRHAFAKRRKTRLDSVKLASNH